MAKGEIFMDNNNYSNNSYNNGNVNNSNNAYNNSSNDYNENGNNNYNTNSYTNRYNNQDSNYRQDSFYSYQNQSTGQNHFAGQSNTTWQSGSSAPKKKKEKKSSGFGKKLVKCAALALVFGLVAGTAMTGVYYVGTKSIREELSQISSANGSGSTASDDTILNSSNGIEATQTSANYVATDISDIVDEAMPSVVAITNISETEYRSFWGGQKQTYESTSCGSGIIIGQDDNYLYIVTNNHVVDGAKSLTVTFADDATVSAEVKGTDPSTDLAVVKAEISSIETDTMNAIKVATIGDSDNLRVGEACIAIGNALGYGQSVTTGVISALGREVSVSDSSSGISYTAELIQTDAAINPGNSGGALLDASGAVIGINSVKYADTEVEGIGYAIPISTAAPIIEELITKEKVDSSDSAYLGIAGVDVTSDVAETYRMPTGVYVAQVMEGTAAAQYGIQQGDIITAFDGKEITSMEGLTSTMEYYAAGTTVDITVQRVTNGQYTEVTVSVVLGKKN